MKVNYLITENNITVNYNGQTHTLARTDAYADKLLQAIKEGRHEDIPQYVSIAKRIEETSNGEFTVVDGEVYVNGVKAPNVVGRKIADFAREGLPYQPLVKFVERLNKNPSYRAVNELYQFLEKNNHPITEEGLIICYKKVRPNFKDIHSGTFDNSPGNVVEVPRNEVDEDCNRTCSHGLHVANWDYAHNKFGGSGDVMIEVEVDPADFVAIPVDYNQSKARVCKYRVIGLVEKELSTSLRKFDTPAYSSCDDDYEDEEEYCYDCGYDHVPDDPNTCCNGCHDDCECVEDDAEEYCYECDSYHSSECACEEDYLDEDL